MTNRSSIQENINAELFGFPRVAGRLASNATAKILGFEGHDIPILMAAGLLKPLGNPAPNAPRYFAATEIVQLANDPGWLDKATRAITKHWKRKNQRKFKNKKEQDAV